MSASSIRRRELSKLLPEGTIATRTWLMNHGFDRHAVDNLIKSEQLMSVAPGVYTKQDDTPTWQGVVYFLQESLRLNLTVGGLTALDQLGLSQYLLLGTQKKINLYG